LFFAHLERVDQLGEVVSQPGAIEGSRGGTASFVWLSSSPSDPPTVTRLRRYRASPKFLN
jgi:hypothetical protein